MARARRNSAVLETARQRLAGLKAINPAPNFGPSLSGPAYEAEVTGFATDQDDYNRESAAMDERQNRLDARENSLRDLNRRVLSAVEAQYGRDSSEYEQVGGTRLSERKRPTGRPATKKPPTT
ncbi:MAG: hypothetical protein QOD75_3500 [Blastocatellia bacterium]|jgi:hypothetical protein|nr:hypothetical protein [Blastocatellia bacterium]